MRFRTAIAGLITIALILKVGTNGGIDLLSPIDDFIAKVIHRLRNR